MDLNTIKSIPKSKLVIVSTGSQGENMSALYRMALSTHKQVDITSGDRIIISASAIPGNEKVHLPGSSTQLVLARVQTWSMKRARVASTFPAMPARRS